MAIIYHQDDEKNQASYPSKGRLYPPEELSGLIATRAILQT